VIYARHTISKSVCIFMKFDYRDESIVVDERAGGAKK
jgi:hypothetical protein